MKRIYLTLLITCYAASSIFAQNIDTKPKDLQAVVEHKEDGGEDATQALANAAANPLADMISFPIQNNFNFGYGPDKKFAWTTNLQPVLPYRLSKNLLMVNRIIIPISYAPKTDAEGGGGDYGMGNTAWTSWVVPTPRKFGKNKGIMLTWGFGPIVNIPTATSYAMGGDEFGIGPTVLVVIGSKHVTGGFLYAWLPSYKTDGLRVQSAQYFLVYNIKNGWFINSVPNIAANNNIPEGNIWLLPLGGGGGRVMKIGKQPVKWGIQGFKNVVKPEGAADWSLQFQFVLLFPKKPKS